MKAGLGKGVLIGTALSLPLWAAILRALGAI